MVIAAVSQNGGALQYASTRLRNHKAVVTAAVSQNGLALVHASVRLKDDEEVVNAAAQGDALKHASVRLQEEFVFTALAKLPPSNQRSVVMRSEAPRRAIEPARLRDNRNELNATDAAELKEWRRWERENYNVVDVESVETGGTGSDVLAAPTNKRKADTSGLTAIVDFNKAVKVELDSSQRKVISLEDSATCIICRDRPRTCLFDCNHLLACGECADELIQRGGTATRGRCNFECPICKQQVRSVSRGVMMP